jgi:hypothetical protein
MLVFIVALAGLLAGAAEVFSQRQYEKEKQEPAVRGTRAFEKWKTDFWVGLLSKRHTWVCSTLAFVAGIGVPWLLMPKYGVSATASTGLSLLMAMTTLLSFGTALLLVIGPTGLNLLIDQLMEGMQGKPPKSR